MSHDPVPHTIAELEETLHAHDQWFRHDEREPHHQSAHGQTNAFSIIGFMVATLALVVVVGVVVFFLWEGMVRHRLVVATEGRTPRGEYLSLRAQWTRELSGYEWTDAAAGKVSIPLEDAKKRVLAFYAGGSGTP